MAVITEWERALDLEAQIRAELSRRAADSDPLRADLLWRRMGRGELELGAALRILGLEPELQAPVGRRYVDILLVGSVAVEVDGPDHEELRAESDEDRTEELGRLGVTHLFRFRDTDAERDPAGCAARLLRDLGLIDGDGPMSPQAPEPAARPGPPRDPGITPEGLAAFLRHRAGARTVEDDDGFDHAYATYCTCVSALARMGIDVEDIAAAADDMLRALYLPRTGMSVDNHRRKLAYAVARAREQGYPLRDWVLNALRGG